MSRGLTTQILHADRLFGAEHGATHKPLHVSAAFGYETAAELAAVFQGDRSGHVYARQGNPTSQALESKITLLEGGVGTVCFATGMGAIASLLFALLKRGDHIVASQFLFGNTSSLLQTLETLGCSVSLVDATVAENVAAALRPETRIVFAETIANPRTQIADLEGIGRVCSERGVLYVVDNTMTTPYLFRPSQVKAGLVINSLTKSISGHGNVLGGAVTDTGLFDWGAFSNIQASYKKGAPKTWGLLQIRKKGLRDLGATLSAEAAHRIATGAETLALRMDRACDNALKLCNWLEAQPPVALVHYPGLPNHAQHDKARQWFRAFGALMSFELKEGHHAFAFLDALQLVIKSSHLGDNRTLAIPVAQTIFWEMGLERRQRMGIAESLIRVSVGIEDFIDLRADFAQALGKLAL
jgi:O-acetylhomoserine (thiol)-lyase